MMNTAFVPVVPRQPTPYPVMPDVFKDKNFLSRKPQVPTQLSFSFFEDKQEDRETYVPLDENALHCDVAKMQQQENQRQVGGAYQRNQQIVPDVIARAWSALIPAITELTWHIQDDRLNVFQHVRRTRNAMKKDVGHSNSNVNFQPDTWVMGLLFALGILPREELDEDLLSRKEKVHSLQNILKPANASPQSRDEALMCLEILCTKVWHLRHINGMASNEMFPHLFNALKFMYWECSKPVAFGFLGDTAQNNHDICKQVYRQLYVLDEQKQVQGLVDYINAGTVALMQYRLNQQKVFARLLRRDARWKRTFIEHGEVIKSKYTALDSQVNAIPDQDEE